MLRLAFLVMLTALLGCGRGTNVAGPLGQAAGEGNWFCESTPDGESWNCVRDAELANDPRIAREAPGEAHAATAPMDPESVGVPPAADGPVEPETATLEPPVPAEPPPVIEPQLNIAQPASTVPLLDLPPGHYTVQLIAMSSAEQLRAFTARHGLENTLSARVERSGEIYYALLLGVYASREQAEQAALSLPAPLDASEPWIRRVGSLQNAMRRASALAPQAP